MLTALGASKMRERSCDINDVAKAASDLVALGGTMGGTHFNDSMMQLNFGSIIGNYVNGIIKDVSDGTISAWEGVQEITAEYADLSSTASFYVQNGITVAAGTMQMKVGFALTRGSYGAAAPAGAFFVAHGFNNIYEGGMNIYNGPAAPAARGPVRRAYQSLLRDDYKGNMAYGAVDLVLSAGAMTLLLRKAGSVQFFRRDPLNYEPAYKQSGKLALFFEILVDSMTMHSMITEEHSE